MLTIAYLGNFSVSYCTESDIAWTLRTLGHTVVELQENRVNADEVLAAAIKCDLFLWTHTHSFSTSGDMLGVLATLKANGVPTAMLHLDLYWGIPAREQQIGRADFWGCTDSFTADGNHQAEFAARGVRHHYLPPAVVARGCYRGEFRSEYATDVAFVGARNYHSEYPFRAQLVTWLEATYGHRFRYVGGGLRERALNDFYQSAKILVGDCCFSGTPFYTSDRVFETVGRNGFLIHPKVEGLYIPGLVTFAPQNLHDLKEKIDYYLDPAHEAERVAIRDAATAHVAKYDTYTNRVSTMLSVMGLQ